jgi:flagellar protein FliO/FliZ
MLLYVLQAVFALAVTLGLVAGAAYVVRRWAPEGFLALRAQGARRLGLVETLILGPQHRLVLVRLDGEERLLLLGDGRALETLPKAPPRSSH